MITLIRVWCFNDSDRYLFKQDETAQIGEFVKAKSLIHGMGLSLKVSMVEMTEEEYNNADKVET